MRSTKSRRKQASEIGMRTTKFESPELSGPIRKRHLAQAGHLMPNHSIERMSNRLRRSATAYVKR
jgi:hypothetical protein